MGRNYTQEELETMRRTGVIPGRSRVSNRIARTKLQLRKKRPHRPKWTAEEQQQLRELHAQGLSARDIAQQNLLAKSQMAIQKQLRRLGLTRGRPVVKFSAAVRELFRSFLQEHFQGNTPLELTNSWNEKFPQYAVNKRRTVAYLARMKLKIPYAEVIRLQNLKKREQQIWASNGELPPPVVQEKIRWQRAELLRNRVARGRDLWSGLQLPPEELAEDTADGSAASSEG